MMDVWGKLLAAIGKEESSLEFLEFQRAFGERPDVLSDPEEYNDPVGRTKYYKFFSSGVEVGFRSGLLNHAHIYVQPSEGYSAFDGELCCGLSGLSTCQKVIDLLGQPAAGGGGKIDPLIGYIGRWLKYKKKEAWINLQFNQDEFLCRVTLVYE